MGTLRTGHKGVLLALSFGLLIGASMAFPKGVLAHGESSLEGRLVNGTAGGDVPAGVPVTLHIIAPGSQVTTESDVSDEEGRYEFSLPEAHEGTSYALVASYQGVDYGQVLDTPLPSAGVAQIVYDSTSDLGFLEVDSAVLLIRPEDANDRTIDGTEVVSLVNTGDRTVVPDLSEGAAGEMSFLRFSIPPMATGLRVDSDLSGGEIINVGPGFALTAPVPPGKHLIGFSYQFPYEGNEVEFTRSFHVNTGSIRVLVHDSVKEMLGSGLLKVAPAAIGEDPYQAWEAGPFASGTKITMEFTGLPQPPWYQRTSDTVLHGIYPKVGILTVLGVALGTALLYSIFMPRMRSTPRLATAGSEAPGYVAGSRQLILEAVADIDEAYERSEIPDIQYHAQREALMARLIAEGK